MSPQYLQWSQVRKICHRKKKKIRYDEPSNSPTGMAVTVVTAPVVARDNTGGPWPQGMATAAAGTEIRELVKISFEWNYNVTKTYIIYLFLFILNVDKYNNAREIMFSLITEAIIGLR